MIKIIKDGKKTKIREVQKFKAVCANCGCEFEFTEDDFEDCNYDSNLKIMDGSSITLNGTSNITYIGGTYKYVRCPFCNKEIKRDSSECKSNGFDEVKVPIDKYDKQTSKQNNFEEADPCTNCYLRYTGSCYNCKHNKYKPFNPNIVYCGNGSTITTTGNKIDDGTVTLGNCTTFSTTANGTITTNVADTEAMTTAATADIPDFGHVYLDTADLKGLD